MNPKQEMILKFEKYVDNEIKELDKIVDPHDRFIALDTLHRIHLYLKNFDELTPVLDEHFENKRRKEKWGER